VTLHLYDTASREVSEFKSLKPSQVSIYVCGATVQGPPHIGHVRSGVNFDILRRWLIKSGYGVTFIRNVTDIDDKILHTAKHDQMPWWAVAMKYERVFTAAYAELNIMPPTYEPRATGHITQMIELMQKLIDNGAAYAPGNGDVYLEVRKLKSYLTLSRQNIDDLQAAADADETNKKDVRDFALWKAAKPGDPSWPTPYENEIAQSEAAGYGFAQRWLHNAWVTQSGEKMSKSLGNSLQVNEILKSVRGIELRWYLGSAHYRSMLEYSPAALEESATNFRRIESFLKRATEIIGEKPTLQLGKEFKDAMNDDLAVPTALASISENLRLGNQAVTDNDKAAIAKNANEIRGALDVLGCDPFDPAFVQSGSSDLTPALDGVIKLALAERASARERKDFAASDAIRDGLADLGITIEDTAQGPRWSIN